MSDILSALRFVQGAVARKDVLPELTHFRIKEGRITAYNGRMALSSPIPLDLDITPKAESMLKAIRACTETVAMHVTAAGRLAIKSGKYRAYIDCVESTLPAVEPEGITYPVTTGWLAHLGRLAPCIGIDASRQWAMGVLLARGCMYATNNVVLAAVPCGLSLPEPVNLPRQAVNELLRIGEDPESVQVTATSATFHWPGGRWLRTSLYETKWPDVDALLMRPMTSRYNIEPDFFDSVRSLAPFVDGLGRVYLDADGIRTHSDPEVGAHVECGVYSPGIFNYDQLLIIEGIADVIDWETYPQACRFSSGALQGAIIGMAG